VTAISISNDRWLSFVRHFGAIKPSIEIEASGIVGSSEAGMINDLAQLCVAACTHCSTTEM
jgi:hypothetical protein